MTANMHSHWITLSGEDGHEGDAGALFPYWSFTKTVIAICALRLAEDGALDPDAPLEGRPWTLRQLLAHRAGLPDYGQFPEYGRAVRAGEAPWPRERMLDLALSGGMLFAPGQGWSYSNIGYMFARERIEAVTGRSFGEVARDLVCAPLGLGSVEFATGRDRFSRLHWTDGAGYDPAWVYHGCLMGTAGDAARLLHGLFKDRLLRPETLAAMRVATPLGGPMPGRPWASCGYGLGLMSGTVERLGRCEGHSGVGPFCVNAVYHFPDLPEPVTVASFTDGSDEGVAEHAAAAIAARLGAGCVGR